ncbi:hypothetical protein [Parasphingorhabdus sp.]|uniref:hypothetical protein n=1 Tax=Parasphingorhabdus sp. TaxID=2709688 RepID=UPI003C724793
MSSVLDNLADFGIKFEKPLSIFGGVWFVASCAVYARFISLPDIPFLTDQVAVFVSAGYNAIWWGFLRPAVEKRKTARLTQNDVGGEVTHG